MINLAISSLVLVSHICHQILHYMVCKFTQLHNFFSIKNVPLVLTFTFQRSSSTNMSQTCSSTTQTCMSFNKGAFTSDEAKLVLKKLDLLISQEEEERDTKNSHVGKCKDCKVMDGAMLLLEEKVASMEELRGAFSVFDRSSNGYITSVELHKVMRDLGLREGMRLEGCKKMVEAFDLDGDGRICFLEFKRMMEGAT